MNMRKFRYVLTLAYHRSFSKAADELNISQPSLSQYILKIEKELDVSLFDRSGSDVRLTDAGRIYIEVGRQILDLERQMQNRLSDLREFNTGSIIIGVSPYRGVCLMPHVLSRFHERYPGMTVIMDERVGSDLIESARHGDFDLCITTLPVDERVFSYELIMRDEVVVAMPSDSPLCRKAQSRAERVEGRLYPAIDPALLDGEEFVMISESQVMQQILDRLCESQGLHLRKTVECISLEAQLAMVKAGLGAALMPTSLTRFSENDGAVTFFSLKPELPFREIVVAFRKGQVHSRAIADLIDIMKNIGST